jgi:hypothetical protein
MWRVVTKGDTRREVLGHAWTRGGDQAIEKQKEKEKTKG